MSIRLTPSLSRAGVLLLGGALALGACLDDSSSHPGQAALPLTPEAVVTQSEANVRTLAESLWMMQAWLDDSVTVKNVEDAVGGSEGEAPVPAPQPNYLVFSTDEQDEFNQQVDELVDFVEAHVFTESQVESSDGTSVTYRIDPQTFCARDEGESGSGGGTGAVPRDRGADGSDAADPADGGSSDAPYYDDNEDPQDDESCLAAFQQVTIRLRVESLASGDLDITLLAGPARDELAFLELHQEVVSIRVDLAVALETFREMALAVDPDDPGLEALEEVRGVIRIAARKLTSDRVVTSFDVLNPIRVEGTVDGSPFVYSLAQGSLSLDADATAQTVAISSDYRDLVISGAKQLLADMGSDDCASYGEERPAYPGGDWDGNSDDGWDGDSDDYYYDDCESDEPAEPVEGDFALSLDRAAVSFMLTESQQEIELHGVVFGPLTLNVDGQEAFRADISAGAGVPFGVVIHADEPVSMTVSPSLAVALRFRLGGLSDIWPDVADTWMMDDALSIVLDGATAPSVTFEETGLMIDSGNLTLESTARPDLNMSVPAGMCMFGDDDDDAPQVGEAGSGDDAPAYEEDDDSNWHPFELETAAECPEYDYDETGSSDIPVPE